MAGHDVLYVTTRKLNVVQWHEAPATVLSAGRLLASVSTRLVQPLAGLRTRKDAVHAFRVTSRQAHMTTVRQAPDASLRASSFGAEPGKVIGLGYF